MQTIFYATGYNSFTNKQVKRVFKTSVDAYNFCNGLTDPKIYGFRAKSILEACNKVLMALEQ